jgi:hypothetical protein
VRVAHALAKLPKIAASMARGELSYSKVRALTRVAIEAPREHYTQAQKKERAEARSLSTAYPVRGITCPYRPCHPCRRPGRHVHARLPSAIRRP